MAIVAIIFGSVLGTMSAGLAWAVLGASTASAAGLYLAVSLAVPLTICAAAQVTCAASSRRAAAS